ncbi:MAG: hypothetical protein NT098_00570, partial [Candidatus Parcubacteria bacterium]|nr:hypothetical protein [Candidatus Parcubacteria bacterium]
MGTVFKYLRLILLFVVVGITVSYCSQMLVGGNTKSNVVGAKTELSAKPTKQPDYSAFVKDYQSPDTKVSGVEINSDGKIITKMKDGAQPYETYLPPVGDDNLVSDLLQHNISVITHAPVGKGIGVMDMVWIVIGVAILAQVGMMIFGKGAGGAGAAGKFGKSKANFVEPKDITTRFVDVAGVEEAVVDVAEVVDFLHNPDPYTALGAKIPRGVILTGPPGCGK